MQPMKLRNMITTVSKTYAEEIKSNFFGENLNSIINKRSDSLYGIVSGIDYRENDPMTDNGIFENFGTRNLEDKYVNKNMLQQDFSWDKSAQEYLQLYERVLAEN